MLVRIGVVAVLAGLVAVPSVGATTPEREASETAEIEMNQGLVDEQGRVLALDRVVYFATVRADFGFPSSLDLLQAIINDHGIHDEWRFPVTPDEESVVEAHIAVQGRFDDNIILAFRELRGYAGFYFDHLNGGAPTVLFTDPTTVADGALGLVPEELRHMLVIQPAEYSWEDLRRAVDRIVASSDPTLARQVHEVAINTQANRVDVSVKDSSAVAEVESSVASISNVDSSVSARPISKHDVCTSRSTCHSPMVAGIKVTGGGNAGTLAFGIWHDSDKQFLTAGHFSATTYSHPGYGVIGGTAESEYFDGGIDARAIFALDSQVSDNVYVNSSFHRDLINVKYPSVGLYVCMSGIKNLSCGNVQDNYKIYNTAGADDLLGASADYYSQSGDSGAPVYNPYGSSSAYAVGVHSAADGDREFARVWDIPGRMGASILVS